VKFWISRFCSGVLDLHSSSSAQASLINYLSWPCTRSLQVGGRSGVLLDGCLGEMFSNVFVRSIAASNLNSDTKDG
jgi:hypothetical protein